MKRRAERTPEEQHDSDRLSKLLRACREGWDRIIRLSIAKDYALMARPPDVEKAQACEALIHEAGIDLAVFEAGANRLLVKLGEPPLRGLGPQSVDLDDGS